MNKEKDDQTHVGCKRKIRFIGRRYNCLMLRCSRDESGMCKMMALRIVALASFHCVMMAFEVN